MTDFIECNLKIPATVKKEHINMAYSIMSKNMELPEHIVKVNKEVFKNKNKFVNLVIQDCLIRYIPKKWLVPIE